VRSPIVRFNIGADEQGFFSENRSRKRSSDSPQYEQKEAATHRLDHDADDDFMVRKMKMKGRAVDEDDDPKR